MSETLEATFRIVTPMFLGGSNQSPDDGIRPPSVKGALRFWWRALNWAGVREEMGSDVEALSLLHRQECNLFGGAANENTTRPSGQARFLLKVSDYRKSEKPGSIGDGHKYMLGQGLINQRGEYRRKALSAGDRFTVQIRFQPHTDMEKQKQVVHALLAWGLLGGLGSRSRRGIGSIAIESIVGAVPSPPIPQAADDYVEVLKEMGLPVACALPPYSAFSAHTRTDCSVSDSDAWTLLNEVGLEMMRYRGWGFDSGTGTHLVANHPAEQNFPCDHAEMLGAVRGTLPSLLPRRATFGLPHNYFFQSEFKRLTAEKTQALMRGDRIAREEAMKHAKRWARKRSSVMLAPATPQQTRRASPILIHSHCFPNGRAAIIQTLLPATFLPPNEQVCVQAERLRGTPASVPARAEWAVIGRYLDRFTGRKALLTGRAVP